MTARDGRRAHHAARLTAMVFAISALGASAALAVSPRWTDWEQANAVGQKGAWLVIRQPDEGFCYITQGYDGYSDKMDLSMKLDAIPYLTHPFFSGTHGDVSYRVDDGSLRIVPEGQSRFAIKLSAEVVPEMKRGNRLVVRLKPVDKPTLEQSFDLRGFAAAAEFLGSATCREKVPDRYQGD